MNVVTSVVITAGYPSGPGEFDYLELSQGQRDELLALRAVLGIPRRWYRTEFLIIDGPVLRCSWYRCDDDGSVVTVLGETITDTRDYLCPELPSWWQPSIEGWPR